MAYIEKDGTLVIIEGDKYIVKGDTLVFLGQEGEENGTECEGKELCGELRSSRK